MLVTNQRKVKQCSGEICLWSPPAHKGERLGGWNLQDLLKCLPPFWFKPPAMFHTLPAGLVRGQIWCIQLPSLPSSWSRWHSAWSHCPQPGHTALSLCHINTHPLSHWHSSCLVTLTLIMATLTAASSGNPVIELLFGLPLWISEKLADFTTVV